MNQFRSLSPSEPTYASLYARCLHRYLAIAQTLQKPDYGHCSSFTLNAPAPTPPRQPWNERPAPPSLSSDPSRATFFRRNVSEGCAFCLNPAHRVRQCPIAEEYYNSGRVTIINERIHLPNSQPIPNNGSNRGLKHAIDTWLAQQSSSTTRDPPPHTPHKSFAIQTYEIHSPPVAKAHLEEVTDIKSDPSSSEDEEDGLDIFGVFATEKKKKQTRAAKLPELTTPKRITRSSTSASPSSHDSSSTAPPSTLPPPPSTALDSTSKPSTNIVPSLAATSTQKSTPTTASPFSPSTT